MNYAEQQHFLRQGRIWGMLLAVALAASAIVCVRAAGENPRPAVIVFALIVLALAVSLVYTPDYLQLTVNPDKKPRWEIKIRSRVIGAAFVLNAIFTHSNHSRMIALAAILWLTVAHLVSRQALPNRHFPAYFWITDLIMLALLLLGAPLNLLLGASLLAVAAHLSIVICDSAPFLWTFAIAGSGCIVFIYAALHRGADLVFTLAGAGLILLSGAATGWLVHRAQQRHETNVNAAMRELMDFTGYPAERVRQLWSVSNQQLAKNWEAAKIAENDSERMVEWYRQNSELYMFAISAYNLEYKRIISNLKVLNYARGACLDYGAGNGELVLEMARRRHPATYYDVEGVSMKFARHRAAQHNLNATFASSKEELTALVRERGLDTIFSFDVLEHLPDLKGELTFLSLLLNPGGLFVFDLPSGSTKAHPMHLNHDLDFRAHLQSEGLKEQRTILQKLPFWKQEKYVFRRS